MLVYRGERLELNQEAELEAKQTKRNFVMERVYFVIHRAFEFFKHTLPVYLMCGPKD